MHRCVIACVLQTKVLGKYLFCSKACVSVDALEQSKLMRLCR